MTKPPETPPMDKMLQKALDKALYANGSPLAQQIRNFLNGTWLGEPLHVSLKDLPIGAWTATMVLDALSLVCSRGQFAFAADSCMAIGMAGAAAAAIAGLTDWSDVDPPARRIGLAHGLLNIGATAMFAASLVLRRKESRRSGRMVSSLAYAIVLYAGKLGGRMVYTYRVGVDRTAGEDFPQEFTALLPEAELPDSKPTRTTCNHVPILLVRCGERVFAMAETCSHFSGPLAEGTLVGESIVCPLHASRFALEDGRVLDGPAVHPQPCLDVRVHQGQVEVRRPQATARSIRRY